MSGLLWLTPWGLLAATAVLLPILIHLFSRSRGRRVPVGWIALYRQRDRQQIAERRIQQWPLLIVRMLVLMVAAMMLAGLARTQQTQLTGSTAYVTTSWVAANRAPAAIVDNYDQVYVLAEGYPSLESFSPENESDIPVALTPQSTPDSDVISLLVERLSGVKHIGQVSVYAKGIAEQFPDRVPGLGQDIDWRITPPEQSDRGLNPTVSNGDPSPASDQAILSVTVINTPDRRADAELVEDALQTAALYRRVELRLDRVEYPPRGATALNLANEMDSDEPEPMGRKRAVIALGASLDALPSGASVILTDSRSLRSASDPEIANTPLNLITEEVGESASEEAAPFMGGHLKRAGKVTRLLVSGEDLTASTRSPMAAASFPDRLLRLLMADQRQWLEFASAPVDPSAALNSAAIDISAPVQPLTPWLGLLLALLVGLERWLSERAGSEANT